MPSLTDIAKQLGGSVIGDGTVAIDGVASLTSAQRQHLAFYESPAHKDKLARSKAGALLVDQTCAEIDTRPRWVVKSAPRLHFARLAQWLHAPQKPVPGIHATARISGNATVHETATIDENAVIGAQTQIGRNCIIGAGAVVGKNAVVGDESILHPRAVLHANTVVGRRCLIHSGAVLGTDGFGFVRDEHGRQYKIPQLGSLRLGDDVEVGANSAIDRGTLDDTVIGNRVKIDNLVQIGHNVQIGDDTVICGCVGIAGSATIGNGCMIGGGAGIIGHITIGDGAMIAARATVTHSVPAGQAVSSIWPAMPITQWRRLVATMRRRFLN
ncbi:UDP-3-O-(3-hydroxymyristoyl)glucosamine N-acyltransferase [Candidatus Persebacteraceae bacterium Df01]|jgi:UDP-3-O-[3-hydroxymyristoyl] glucosamine N-acyltransferase|uniref:UDP-3-O-acylglucosamine N-acyltransferase n=1 Tax=Candidatus Doriopsillibacter californiensis TaxID=2970740 RepID=A0ABT7QNS4_9GAMM|nr:UDP-3-O-(3-hydroxymyristoyl)glucosamine N-acyltransferase [Candidatus Persebacteraceae bacterium Df01]